MVNTKAIGELFNIDRTVVTKHIRNIYSDFELMRIQLVQILH